MEYGAERKISRHSVLGAAVSVGVPQGVSLKVKYVELVLLARDYLVPCNSPGLYLH